MHLKLALTLPCMVIRDDGATGKSSLAGMVVECQAYGQGCIADRIDQMGIL